jgi:hypothetical protein
VPQCKLINPDSAMRCDCGYVFFSLGSDAVPRPQQERQESRSGWYPTKKQWIVIWISVGLASVFFLDGSPPGALVCIVIGALLVWQVSRPAQ